MSFLIAIIVCGDFEVGLGDNFTETSLEFDDDDADEIALHWNSWMYDGTVLTPPAERNENE